ncbi:MAG: hypothetical protein V4532_07340 [Pseudomonadota bacterium]
MPTPEKSHLFLSHKALGLTAVLVGIVGAYLWQAPAEVDQAPPASVPSSPSAALSASRAITSATTTAPLQAATVAQAYAASRQAANARYKDQRMQIQGRIHSIEPGQAPILLITLGAQDEHPGLRAVIDSDVNPSAGHLQSGQSVVLDCLNQGLVMDEPLLSDCRLRP